MYDANRKVLWASDTNGNFDKVELVVQDDMNVVLYKSEGREVLWATNTHTAVCPDARSDVGKYIYSIMVIIIGFCLPFNSL